MQVVPHTASIRRARIAALLLVLGVAASACTATSGGTAVPVTVTVGSTVIGTGTTSVTVPGVSSAGPAPASSAQGSAPMSSAPISSAASSSAIVLPVAKVSSTPAFGTANIAPVDPVKITVTQGK